MPGDAPTTFSLRDERLRNGCYLIVVTGAVDLFSAPELKRRLLETIDLGAKEVVLDLSQTSFVDSTALGALLTAHKRLEAREGRLVIVLSQPSVSRVFEITGLDSIFALAPSREEALAELAGMA